MEQATKRVRAIALLHFGEGELEINRYGNVFWRMPDGSQIALGYTIFEAEHFFVKLYRRLGRALAVHEEEE